MEKEIRKMIIKYIEENKLHNIEYIDTLTTLQELLDEIKDEYIIVLRDY